MLYLWISMAFFAGFAFVAGVNFFMVEVVDDRHDVFARELGQGLEPGGGLRARQVCGGDLDLSGSIDDGDIAVLLTMIGEQPPLGIGDLDGDGVIGAGDVAALMARMPDTATAGR